MCKFFSCIVTKDGKVFFSEEDSHETIINRLGISDNGENFVRVEYSQNSIGEYEYCLDVQTIPEWYERIAIKVKLDIKQIFQKVKPAWEDYEKIRTPAQENYEKIEAPAREDYEKIKASAQENYKKIITPVWEDYEKIRTPARENYEKIITLAQENYEKIKASAQEDYQKKIAEIVGYVTQENKKWKTGIE